MRSIKIIGWNHDAAPKLEIRIPKDLDLDLAILKFEQTPFPRARAFQLRRGEILERVMVMGYPKIPCFPPLLVTESAEIAAQASLGEIVGQAPTYREQRKRPVEHHWR